MSRTTLVGYDGSETAGAALAYAAQRVGPDGRLVIVHVVAPSTAFIDTQYYPAAFDFARGVAQKVMRGLEDVLAGVPADVRVAEGPPARTLVELARETGADEIVVGSRGFGAGRAMLGSVAHALLHETDRPLVILTRRAAARQTLSAAAPGATNKTAVEMVGYDGSRAARAALDYARARHGQVAIVCAYDPPSSFLGAPYFGEALTDSQLRGQELLDELRSEDGLGPNADFDLLEGPPAEAIARAAAVRDAAEIVVGSRGLGRFRGAFGSVSHALLHEVDRPLVVVPRPEPV